MDLLAVENQKIGPFETEDVLGRGFNSIVYKARAAGSTRPVVVKVIKVPAGFSEADVFISSAGLHHPNLLPTQSSGTLPDGSLYTSREYVEGDTLEGILGERGTIDIREAVHYLAQLSAALDYIHGQNLIHGNIKPTNVIVDSRFRALTFDLGFRSAALLKSEREPLPTSLAHYRAPEQLRDEPLSPAADVFGLGVLAFELVTGSRPFPGRDFTAVVSNILNSEPLSFDDVGSNLSKSLEPCFARALAKDPEARFESAGEFIKALTRILGIFIDEFGVVGGFSSLQANGNDVMKRVRAQTVMTSFSPGEMLGDEELESSELPRPAPPLAEETPSSIYSDPSPLEAKPIPSTGFGLPNGSGHGTGGAANANFQFEHGVRRRSKAGRLAVALVLGVVGAVGYFALSNPKSSISIDDLRDPSARNAQRPDSAKEIPAAVDTGEPPLPPIAEVPPPPPVVQPQEVTNNTTATTLAAAIPPEAAALNSNAADPVRTNLVGLSTAELASLLTSEVSSTVSRTALQEAARRSDPALLAGMVALTDNPDYSVRIAALKALTQPAFVDRDETYNAAAKLIVDNEYLVRGFAAKTLIASKRPEAKQLLEKRRREEKNAIVLKVLSEK